MRFFLAKRMEKAFGIKAERTAEPVPSPDPDAFSLEDFCSWTVKDFDYPGCRFILFMNRLTHFTLVVPEPLYQSFERTIEAESPEDALARSFEGCLRGILRTYHFKDDAIERLMALDPNVRVFAEQNASMRSTLSQAQGDCELLIAQNPTHADGHYGFVTLTKKLSHLLWDRSFKEIRGGGFNYADEAFFAYAKQALGEDPVIPGTLTLRTMPDEGGRCEPRTLVVSTDCTFFELHEALADLYLWEPSHTFRFDGRLERMAGLRLQLPMKGDAEVNDARLFHVGEFADELVFLTYTHGVEPWQKLGLSLLETSDTATAPKPRAL